MSRFRSLTGLGLVFSACAAPLLAAPAERPVERAFGAEVRAVELENLAGRVEIRRAAAGAGRLTAVVHGDDSAGKTGRQWADTLEVEVEQRGARLIVKAYYPLDDHRRYHYPELGKKTRIEPSWLEDWIGDWNTSAEYQGRRVKISGHASSGAPTLWADFTLEVPEGVSVNVKNLVGHISSTGVAGSQVLDSSSGDIDVSSARGDLDADTGSGDVVVTDHEGDLTADTGSGDVELAGVRASHISADTGSGDVRLERCAGAIQANTGSGNIVGRELVVGRRLEADTGSGDVKLSGDFAAVRDMTIDTGSGDVSLVFVAVPSVQLVVSTGSGDIDVDVAAMRVRRSRDEFVADLAGAEGTATIDTGSGDVVVSEGR